MNCKLPMNLTKNLLDYSGIWTITRKNTDTVFWVYLCVSLNEDFRQRFEPNTAKYEDRIASLRALHDAGFYTWVSIEPYPTPNLIEQSLEDILKSVCFVDKIIFGRTNYSKEVSSHKGHKNFYNEAAQKVIDFCDDHGIAYHIKDGTITR